MSTLLSANWNASTMERRYRSSISNATLVVLLCLCVFSLPAQSRLSVTVVDAMGAPLTDLTAGSFQVLLDRSPRTVQKAEYQKDLVDVVLLVDTSAYALRGREQIERMAGM